MTTLLNTFFSKKGELFVIGQGRYVLFAHCKPKISIYEKTSHVSIWGSGCRKKSADAKAVSNGGHTEIGTFENKLSEVLFSCLFPAGVKEREKGEKQ